MKVGLQMYSVKGMIAENALAAFEKVAGMGYRCWEVCQLYGRDDVEFNYGLQMPPKEAIQMLERLKVNVIGSHLTMEQTQDEAYLEACLPYMQEIGSTAIGLTSCYYRKDDIDDVKAWCDHFNNVGRKTAKYGMRFYYHNHFQEFQHFGDKTVYDLLMEYTDPDLVDFELDTYWAMRGGQDPKALIEKYGHRICMLHQKDFPKDAPQPVNLYTFALNENENLTRDSISGKVDPRTFTEVGTGIMNIQEIVDAGNAAGIPYVVLEQDRTQLTEEVSLARSMEAFRKCQGIEWN